MLVFIHGQCRICMKGPDLKEINPVPTIHLWHDACKSQRPNQKKHKEYRKRARKATGSVILVAMKSSSESKCKWTNTELLLFFCFFVSLKEQYLWIVTVFLVFFRLEFAQIRWSYNDFVFFKGTSFAVCRI